MCFGEKIDADNMDCWECKVFASCYKKFCKDNGKVISFRKLKENIIENYNKARSFNR